MRHRMQHLITHSPQAGKHTVVFALLTRWVGHNAQNRQLESWEECVVRSAVFVGVLFSVAAQLAGEIVLGSTSCAGNVPTPGYWSCGDSP